MGWSFLEQVLHKLQYLFKYFSQLSFSGFVYKSVILVALSIIVNKYLLPKNPTKLIGPTKSVYTNW